MLGKKGAVGYIAGGIAIVVFLALLPIIKNTTIESYTLTEVVNESVTISANAGQLANYPLDTSFTAIVSNTTDLFTVSDDYNITYSTGAMETGGSIQTTPILVHYKYQPSSYLTQATARATAQQIFIMVILGLLVFTAMVFGLVGM